MTTAATLHHRLSGDLAGGLLLLTAAAAGLVWANSPWRAAYRTISDTAVGPASWHAHLTLATWAADGLLAVFFLVVGLELKRELVSGTLRDRRHAAVPALAAVGGMVVPAVVYVLVVGLGGARAGLRGWAVPTATDIAFALAVLALVGRGLPGAARVFLLTLAVVDDLLAIVVIAVFYAAEIHVTWLVAAAAAVGVFALVARLLAPPGGDRPTAVAPATGQATAGVPGRGAVASAVARVRSGSGAARAVLGVLLVVLGLTAWVTLHASGIHATIAGVACGLAMPASPGPDGRSPAAHLEHRVRPWSAAVAAPLFAFFAAGVPLGGRGGLVAEPVAWGALLGLVVGKPVGVLGTTALLERFTRLRAPGGLRPRDLAGVGLLAGVGFTVSLLVASLAFDDARLRDDATLAVFAGSLVSAFAAALVLRRGRRAHAPLVVADDEQEADPVD